MIKHVETEVIPLTREFVRDFREIPILRGDRGANDFRGKKRKAYLAEELANGHFWGPDWFTVFVQDENKIYRVNGNTSSTMLWEANGEFPAGLPVSVRRFECDTRGEAYALYQKIDSARSARKRRDIADASKGMDDSLYAIESTFFRTLASGLAFYVTDAGALSIEVEDAVMLPHEYRDFCVWVAGWANSSTKMIRRKAVIAAILTAFEADREKADQFWKLVVNESHPDPANVTRVLGRCLMSVYMDSRGARKRGEDRAVYARCILAMNAWDAGQTLKRLQYRPSNSLPVVRWK